MIFNVIPVLLMFVSLAVIVTLVGRRLPEIAALKLDDIPEAHAAQKKRQLLVSRLEARTQEVAKKGWQKTAGWREKLLENIDVAYSRLQTMDRKYRRNDDKLTKVEVVRDVLSEADLARSLNEWRQAEQLYLDVVREDHRNLAAYIGLGHTYLGLEQLADAKESFAYAAKLGVSDSEVFASLAGVCDDLGQVEEAEIAYREAVRLSPDHSEYQLALGDLLFNHGDAGRAMLVFEELVQKEPANPRLLDRLIESAISSNNKKTATASLRKLKKVNQDNQKIADFEERIKHLN